MRFEFATASRILFGAGTVAEVPKIAASFGKKALVVTGAHALRAERLIAGLFDQGLETVIFSVAGEPTTDVIEIGVTTARENECDLVISIGGGSVLDAGKAIAALMTNPGELMDYLEVVGRGQSIRNGSAPYIAIPTTAGTGTEVTRNAVIKAPGERVKASMRSPLMIPKLAVIDPELTYSMPPTLTASTGLDALTQLMEAFVSVKANPMTDAICREGMKHVAASLKRAYEKGNDAEAREGMSIASLFGGLALANAGLGAVHGIAAPLGGMFPAPHGIACARLLPLVMAANIRALTDRSPDSPALARYDEVARILTGEANADADSGIAWVAALCADLRIPPLCDFGVTEADLPALLEKSQQASSMKGNPILLKNNELVGVLREAL